MLIAAGTSGRVLPRERCSFSNDKVNGSGGGLSVDNRRVTLPPSQDLDGIDWFAYNHFFFGIVRGTFLEVGAGDGVLGSSTLAFERLGWTGVLVEADERSYQSLALNRAHQVTVHSTVCRSPQSNDQTVVDTAPTTGPRALHFVRGDVASSGGVVEFMSSFYLKSWHPAVAANTTASTASLPVVTCTSMESLTESLQLRHVSFMVVNVEGGELSVMQSVNFTYFSADVLVLDSFEMDGGSIERDDALVSLLEAHGYKLYCRRMRNLWFTRLGFHPSVSPTARHSGCSLPPKPPRNESLAVFTIARGEQQYLDEWLMYHLDTIRGIDMMYLYDNEDVPTYHRFVAATEPRVVVIHNRAPTVQHIVMDHFFEMYNGKHTWASHFDIDEYLVRVLWYTGVRCDHARDAHSSGTGTYE